MAYGRSLDEYRKSAVSSASPLQLVIMLYDGALRCMETAKKEMHEGNLFHQNAQLVKAQKILAELMSSLDMQKGGDIAQNLFSLYSYVYNQLVTANVDNSPAGIDQGIQVLSQLRVSWSALEEQQRTKSFEKPAA